MPDAKRSSTSGRDEKSSMFQSAFIQAALPMFIVDGDGAIEAWNAAAERLFGYAAAEALGKDPVFLFASADQGAAFLWRARKEGEVTTEVECATKDGATLHVAFSADALNDGAGRHLVIARESHGAGDDGRLERLFERAFDFVTVMDAKGNVTYSSPSCKRILGYVPSELLGKTVTALVHHDDAERTEKIFRDVVGRSGTSSEPFEVRFKRADGEWVWLEAVISNFFEDKGIAGVVINAHDIGARKAIESRNMMFESRLTAIFNAQAYSVFITTPDQKILDLNPAATRLTGYSRDELLGANMSLFAASSDSDRAGGIGEFFRAHDMTPVVEMICHRKDGAFVPIEAAISAVRDPNGQPTYYVSVIRDITSQKRAEAEVHRLDQLKSKFIQVVAHQCRTPLNAVRWHLETLLAEDLGPLNDPQKNFIKVIHEKSTEIIDLIGDLLTSVEIEEGRITIETDAVALDQLVAGVVNQWRTKCEARGVSCVFQSPEEPLPPVEADATKIRRVITKLVENAVDYTQKGGTVEVSVSISGMNIHVEVRDTGIGIPESEKAGVFSRFFRASNASLMVTDASGLGLYVAKFFIEKHDGKIGFESEENKGSRFWFELPVRRFY